MEKMCSNKNDHNLRYANNKNDDHISNKKEFQYASNESKMSFTYFPPQKHILFESKKNPKIIMSKY